MNPFRKRVKVKEAIIFQTLFFWSIIACCSILMTATPINAGYVIIGVCVFAWAYLVGSLIQEWRQTNDDA